MTTLDLQVGASADDTRHRTQDIHNFSTTFANGVGNVASTNAGYGSSSRFTAVTIAQADTIDIAYMTLTPEATRSGVTAIGVLDAEASNSGDAPISDADWDNEVKTTATVAWNPIPTFTTDVAVNTPSIVTVVQELINRAGWVSGNAVNLFLHDEALSSSIGAFRSWNSYDNSTTKAPKLHIEYTAGGGGGGAVVRRLGLLLRRRRFQYG